MKAMVLAAGEGVRLRPLTASKPKPMIEVGGAPILEHNIRLLARHGVRDIVVNLHYRPDVITRHFGDGRDFGVSITYSHEPRLLGTAGALKPVEHLFEDDFFLVYGDNLSTCNLSAMRDLHFSRGGLLTMAIFEREDPQNSGVLEVDENDRIVRFVEKPSADRIFSHWINAGYLVVSPAVLPLIPSRVPSDFGRDVFGPLIGSGAPAYGYRMSQGLWWIDSLNDYQRTRAMLANPATLAEMG